MNQASAQRVAHLGARRCGCDPRAGTPTRRRREPRTSATSAIAGSASSMIGGLIMPRKSDLGWMPISPGPGCAGLMLQVHDRLVVDQPLPRVGGDPARAVRAGQVPA